MILPLRGVSIILLSDLVRRAPSPLLPCLSGLRSIYKLIDAIEGNWRNIFTNSGHKGFTNRWQEATRLFVLLLGFSGFSLLQLPLRLSSPSPNNRTNHIQIRCRGKASTCRSGRLFKWNSRIFCRSID